MERGHRSKRKPSKESSLKLKAAVSPVLGSRDEIVPDNEEQYLFLLEFFVQHLCSERLAKLNQMFFVPTTITVEFLNFTGEESIQITPVDPLFQSQAGVAGSVEYFYSGRSVMFAIDQYSVINKLFELMINLCVEKKMPAGVKPDVLVGNGVVDLSMHFAALRKEMLQCWHKLSPPPKVFEGDIPLMYNDEEVGFIGMYVRISAFGQTIVTEFDVPPDRNISSYIFKSGEVNDKSLAYKCRIVDSELANVCADSKEDLLKSNPCRVCIKEHHPCTPCGKIGAMLKPAESVAQPSHLTTSRSKPDTCADVSKQAMIQSSRGPAQPCGKAVVLKVSGILDTGQDRKPTVTVAPESEATPADATDPEHDVFVLRIGKKGIVGAGEKSDIQLEMRTPKGPERGPPIRYETREMQTEDKGKKDGKKKKKKKKEEGK